MYEAKEEFKPQRNSDILPIISNLVLLVFAAVFLWFTISAYEARIKAVSMQENRFLTTEWHLLQELKVQTDQQLLEKDQEIAELRQQYLKLAQTNTSPAELQQIKEKLNQAREERAELASRRVQEAPDSEQASSEQTSQEPLSELLPRNTSATAELLREQIETLEEQLEESRLYNQVLEEEFTEAQSTHNQEIREYRDSIEDLSSELSGTRKAVRTTLEELELKLELVDNQLPPGLEDLNTRALLRALASSPTIRADYPNLLDSIDRYFEVYGFQKQLDGRREAYSSAIESLEPLSRQLELAPGN